MIKLKRAYDLASKDDGIRFLVERLWPCGVSKADLHLDAWLKDVAPSTELRRWFSHDPSKWIEFQRRYFAELNANPTTVEPILEANRRDRVTLVYSSHDHEHNNAVALKAFLATKISRRNRVHPPSHFSEVHRRASFAVKETANARTRLAKKLENGRSQTA